MENKEEIQQLQYYAHFDDIGNISGFYELTMHGDSIPDKAIPITEEEWQIYVSESWRYRINDGTIREKNQQELDEEAANRTPAPPSLDERMETLETESINTMIGLTEVYETTAIKDAERKSENISTMSALTEVYELVKALQNQLDSLKTRVKVLEGGTTSG